MEDRTYILISAVRNEEKYIRRTLASVCSQTVLPKLWIVCINDSIDNTKSIVEEASQRFPFIVPLVLDFGGQRSFSNQVLGVREGFKHVSDVASVFLGLLDGDVSFGSGYFEDLMARFAGDPKLGVGGGAHVEQLCDGTRTVAKLPEYLVMGPNQFFRRQCFEQIGGHRPLRWGGQDTLACVMASMKGWNTGNFSDLVYYHHRQMGSQGTTITRARFIEGIRDQKLGMHPFYALARTLNRLARKPYVWGTLCWLAGYCCGFLLPDDSQIPSECRWYFRAMQLRRLQDWVAGKRSGALA